MLLFIFLIPVYLAFECTVAEIISEPLTYLSPIFFCFDIFVNLNTGFFEKKKKEI